MANISAESAIHGQAQGMDETALSALVYGAIKSWGGAPRLKVKCAFGAKTDAATCGRFQRADMSTHSKQSCSRFPAGSVRVAHRATATVESLQSIATADLVRTCIHGC